MKSLSDQGVFVLQPFGVLLIPGLFVIALLCYGTWFLLAMLVVETAGHYEDGYDWIFEFLLPAFFASIILLFIYVCLFGRELRCAACRGKVLVKVVDSGNEESLTETIVVNGALWRTDAFRKFELAEIKSVSCKECGITQDII